MWLVQAVMDRVAVAVATRHQRTRQPALSEQDEDLADVRDRYARSDTMSIESLESDLEGILRHGSAHAASLAAIAADERLFNEAVTAMFDEIARENARCELDAWRGRLGTSPSGD
jgi:hypothetical protein